jgi:predicted nucleic acid-binding protein
LSLLVVDASVAAKWLGDEEHTEAAITIVHEGNQLHAPDFLILEVHNVICKWIRRGIVSPSEANIMRETFRPIPIQLHPFMQLLDSAFAIANLTRQGIYDCVYVALAVLLEGRLVTADRKSYVALKDSPFKKHVMWVEELG